MPSFFDGCTVSSTCWPVIGFDFPTALTNSTPSNSRAIRSTSEAKNFCPPTLITSFALPIIL